MKTRISKDDAHSGTSKITWICTLICSFKLPLFLQTHNLVSLSENSALCTGEVPGG